MITTDVNTAMQDTEIYKEFVAARRNEFYSDTPDDAAGTRYVRAYDAVITECKRTGASGFAVLQRGVQEAAGDA